MTKKEQSPPEMVPFKNLHQALQDSVLESREREEKMINFSVRLPPELKAAAMEICEKNSTDLGTFLRHCAASLVEEYRNPNVG